MKAPPGDWTVLVQRAQAGDGDAFTELFQQLHSPVLNYVYRTLGDRQAAEDITQDAFIRAHQRIGQLGPPYDFKSWLFRIASNLAVDRLRRSKRFIDLDESMEPLGPMTTRRPAEKKVQQDQVRESVQDTLVLMPTTYRQAIILRELNGLGYQEVANALECSYDNARQLVHRARLNFRELHGMRLLATSGATQCREIGDLLSALHDGELSDENRRAVRKHIKSCEHCQETEKDVRKVAAILAGLPPIFPSPDWITRVLEGLPRHGMGSSPPQAGASAGHAAGAGASSGKTLSTLSTWFKTLAGAAFALISVGAMIAAGVWVLSQFPSPPATAEPQVVEATVQAILALTPVPSDEPESPATEESALLPPMPPTSTPATVQPDSIPAVSGPPLALGLVNSNCRGGPGGVYDILDYLLVDQQTPIVGRDAGWFWWVVERINGPGTCWVANNLVDEIGDTSLVPVVPAPPTPAPVDVESPMLSLSHLPLNPLSNQVITFEVNASDASGVAWIEIWVRPPGQSVATLIGTCQNVTQCRLQGGPYSAGKGEYFARAEDVFGNEVESLVKFFDVTWYIG